ncbi:MAG TPA: VTC domain-containing protein, partial [Candidatus Acidoferrales bacterium]|nr:VTC domain-containing protein [Candidatus Acidoferrales bacterium]
MSLPKTVSPETARLADSQTARKRRPAVRKAGRHEDHQRNLQRYETKYVIPKEMVPEIRALIQPFCVPDPNGVGDPPTYVNTTLQLDSPGLSLHYAKLWDFVDRFKLRVRTYGDPVGEYPVVLEVKGKDRNMIFKHRCQIPFALWGEHLFQNQIIKGIHFQTAKETDNFYQFIRLV